jgi:hypothetical protein
MKVGLSPAMPAVEGHVNTLYAVAVSDNPVAANGQCTGWDVITVGGNQDVAVEFKHR